ncbi:MAG: cytochrome c [Pseudomonadota bacterium]|nr:cytochrome c [Pseudomonadota bacterium]
MKFIKSIQFLAILIIFCATEVFADNNILAGKQKSETCLGCHAVPGYNNVYPTYKVPKLGGQHSDYIKSALKSYQKLERGHNTMHANAKGLTDEDIDQIAKYFESIQ